MLSHKEIKKRCHESKCVIASNYDSNNMCIIPVSGQEASEVQESIFTEGSLKAVRLSITLGPIVKKQNAVLKREHRFKNHKNILDLTKCGGRVILGPRETVSVLSNEYIRFDGSIAALIIPRLTLADVGISLIPTYIDPYWDGILQMSLVNNTSSAFELNVGESIAQCFFFDVAGDVDIEHKNEFPRKSHHFGQTWEKILEEDAEPFPRKKRISELGYLNKLRYFFSNYKVIFSSLVTSGLIVSIVFGAGKLYTSVSYLETQFEKLSVLRNEVNKIKVQQEEDHKRLAVKGSSKVTIEASRKSATDNVPVNINIVGKPILFSDTDSEEKLAALDVIVGKIENDIVKEIVIFIELVEPAKKDVVIDVNWVLIP